MCHGSICLRAYFHDTQLWLNLCTSKSTTQAHVKGACTNMQQLFNYNQLVAMIICNIQNYLLKSIFLHAVGNVNFLHTHNYQLETIFLHAVGNVNFLHTHNYLLETIFLHAVGNVSFLYMYNYLLELTLMIIVGNIYNML